MSRAKAGSYSAARIASRVKMLGRAISQAYRGRRLDIVVGTFPGLWSLYERREMQCIEEKRGWTRAGEYAVVAGLGCSEERVKAGVKCCDGRSRVALV